MRSFEVDQDTQIEMRSTEPWGLAQGLGQE